MARYLILNSIRGYVHNHREEYGPEVVIAVDGAHPWRRDIFPHYKAKRREGREQDDTSDIIYEYMDIIRQELENNFPYKVVKLDGVEADDVIAVIIKKNVKKWFTNKYLIISSDKDFQQLQKYPNVTQYSPVLKKFYETDSPQEYIYEHILRGDPGDGIPNFLSPDDTFINGIKSKPIMKKKLVGWVDTLMRGEDAKEFCNEYHYRNFQRNQRLIDFDFIPEDIQDDIYKQYEEKEPKSKSDILPYLIKNDLQSLIGKIEEF
jgi:5'-3' exonuclease